MKTRTVWVLIIIIVAQLAVLSLFHYDSYSSNTNFTEEGNRAIIFVAKMRHVHARVDISAPYSSWAEIILPDGSTYNITGGQTFTTFFAGRLTWSMVSSTGYAGPDIVLELSPSHPLDIYIANGVSAYPFPPYFEQRSEMEIYNITIITPYMTAVNAQGYGVST
jgi:hypothetical protein